mgnify:FL=1
MDITDLERKLGIEGMSADEQMKMVIALQKSVSQKASQERDQTIGKSAEIVIQGLKKIKSDMEMRFSELSGDIQGRVASIKDGRDGKNGKDGKDGKQGPAGATGPAGRDGVPGRDGVDGANGVGVSNAYVDFDGQLVIVLDNGREINAGDVVAPDLAERIKVITNGGGTSQYVLDTLTSLQNQINAIVGGLVYKGTWNASTNTPTLTSSVGTANWYYVVSVSGSTNLNGITDWVAGDWAIYNGSAWQKIDQTNLVTSVNGQTGAVNLTYTNVNAIGSITSVDGSVTVSTASGIADLSVAVAASTTNVICQVRNTTGATLTKGTAVYISGATGQIPTVTKALATSDATSAQTLGLINADLANNTNGYVTIIGLITEIDTSAYTDGAQLYLSGTTAGTLTATKTYAPTHLVYVAVVEYAHPVHGKLFVKVQNGYELDEIHNVSAQSPSNGQTIIYNATTTLWEKANLTAGTGVSVTNGAGSITIANTGVTSVSGTSPVASSGGATPAISLANGYGDTQNPFASKTANYFLAAPNGLAGAPTFRAMVAADVPTLNQNTTGTAANITGTTNSTLTTLSALSLPGSQVSGNISGNAANVTGTVAIANGGTGQTTKTTAYDALNPNTTLGDIAYRDASNNVRLAGNTTTTKKFLAQTGTGTVSAAPAWATLVAGDVPTLNQDTTGSAGSLVTTNFSIVQSGTKLLFKYGATTIASMDSTGVITSATNIVANGTP